MPRPLPYRFQYQKKLWGVLKNVWRKKMFSAKSMTKLEALTVLAIFKKKGVKIACLIWIYELEWNVLAQI
jgi:hypothetical protein